MHGVNYKLKPCQLILVWDVFVITSYCVCAYFQDYMEYKRFEDDVNKTTFGENQNPLYRDPQTEHQNPLFTGKGKGKEEAPPYNPPEKC